jgi:kinesin family protein 2/24
MTAMTGVMPEWVNFSLGEDVRDERRLEQDRKWASAVQDGRIHLSHREFALLYGARFLSAIRDHSHVQLLIYGMFKKKCILSLLNEVLMTIIIEYALPGQGPLIQAIMAMKQAEEAIQNGTLFESLANQHFRICLRKRPLMDMEIENGGYDVARVISDHSLILHEGKLARNGRVLSMSHHHFQFDKIFHEHTTNLQVCIDAVEPLLQRAMEGHRSTLLCFGQTGTGKTYTLYGALEYLADHLIGSDLTIELIFYEVHGQKCYDLLQNRRVVHLRFDENENLHVRGARTITLTAPTSSDELRAVLKEAITLRSSLVTERNPISSRSHAVCQIDIIHRTSTTTATLEAGRITLVDLAGSERNYETLQMSAALHRESADINLALMSLKNCFRAASLAAAGTTAGPAVAGASQQRIPYRESTLTKVLKDCFVVPTAAAAAGRVEEPENALPTTASTVDAVTTSLSFDCCAASAAEDTQTAVKRQAQQQCQRHHTTIIATVSPSPVDLLHSLNTIRHVLLMSAANSNDSSVSAIGQSVTVEVPKTALAALSTVSIAQWSPEQVIAWLTTVERGRFAMLALPAGGQSLNGQALLELSVVSITQLFATAERMGRNEETEGPAWTVEANRTRRLRTISQALFNAVRREEILHAKKGMAVTMM